MDEHLESPQEKAAFLCNLLDHHYRHQSPDFPKILGIHVELMQKAGLDPVAELSRRFTWMKGLPFQPAPLREPLEQHLERSYLALTNFPTHVLARRVIDIHTKPEKPVLHRYCTDVRDITGVYQRELPRVLQTGNKEIFHCGLESYRQLALRQDIDRGQLAAVMDMILLSPSASLEKGFQKILEALWNTCSSDETLFIAHETTFEKAIALCQKNGHSYEAMGTLLTRLCCLYHEARFQDAHRVLKKLMVQYLAGLKHFNGIHGASRCAIFLEECFTFSFLQQDLLTYLSRYLWRLSAVGDEDSVRAMEIVLKFERFISLLPVGKFCEIFCMLLPLCKGKYYEAFLEKGLARIYQEGSEADKAHLQEALEKNQFLEDHPSLRNQAFPEVAAKEAARKKMIEEAPKLIKSKNPFASIDEVRMVIDYLPLIDFQKPKSLEFISKHYDGFLQRIRDFIKTSPPSKKLDEVMMRLLAFTEEQAKKVKIGIDAEINRQNKPGVELSEAVTQNAVFLFKYLTNLNIASVYLHLFSAEKSTGLDLDQRFAHLSEAVDLHCSLSTNLDRPTFLKIWKDLIEFALSQDEWLSKLLPLYTSKYNDSTLDPETLIELKGLLHQEVVRQYQLRKNPLLIDFAVEKKKKEEKKGECPQHEVLYKTAKKDSEEANLYSMNNDFAKAEQLWTKAQKGLAAAIEKNPKNPDYYYEFCRISEKLENWQIVTEVLTKGLKTLGETDPILLRYLGKAFSCLNRKDSAVLYMEKAYALDQETPCYAGDLMACYHNNGQNKKAIELATAYLIRKHDILIQYLRGKISINDHQYVKGIADLKAVLAESPGYADATKWLNIATQVVEASKALSTKPRKRGETKRKR